MTETDEFINDVVSLLRLDAEQVEYLEFLAERHSVLILRAFIRDAIESKRRKWKNEFYERTVEGGDYND